MGLVYVITHPDVIIDPTVPVPRWSLSDRGKARMRVLLAQPWVDVVRSVYCSTEQKAIDGAAILAEHLGIGDEMVEALGEIDRSSTGYLSKEEHDAAAGLLFLHPEKSVRGWERAVDAQRRMVAAVETLLMNDRRGGDTAIVTHGAVATLYLCHLKGCPISKDEGPPGAHGGAYYCFDGQSRLLVHDWKPIDE